MEGYEITGTSSYYDLYDDEEFWLIDRDKNITAPKEVTIMQGETGSQYIPFKIDRYQDGIDLAEMQWTIIWNTENDGDSCLAVNSYMNSDYVVFAWLIDGKVTNEPGEVAFQIQGTGLNEKEESYVYLTKIKAITITKSLDSQRFILEQPQLYNELMNYVQGVLEGSTGTIYAKLSRNLAVMEARISEIAATAGTNTTDTEVADARVRLNGTSAVCLGDELRAKADGYVYEDGKFYLTSGGIKITNGIEFKTDLSDYLTEKQIMELLSDGTFIETIEETDEGFVYVKSDGKEYHVKGKGGLNFDSGYQDDNGYMHLTLDGEDINGYTPFLLRGGSGGGSDTGSKLKLSMYTASSFSVLDTIGTALIKGNFTSVDAETGVATGAGNLSITVAGVLRENKSIAQGNFEVDVFKYLNTGTNTVKLVMTDSYGSSVTRNFTIVKESLGISWNLESVNKNSGTLSFYLTPTGSGDKTIHVLVDGVEKQTHTVSTSGRRLSVSIADLAHGSHSLEVYGEMTVSGSVLESEHLIAAIAQVESNKTDPMVAIKWPTDTATQFTTISVEYMVVDPQNNPAEISILVNGVVQETKTVDQSAQIWSYKPVVSGEITLGIMCGTKLESKKITVTSLGSDMEEITDGLVIKMDPSVMTNLDGWSYGGYTIELSEGFDLVNGGLQTDENGVHCIRITAGDRMTLKYPAFAGDARKTGKEIKIIYKVKDSSNREAEAISCMSGGIGFKVLANNVYASGDQTTVKLPVCEDEKTELDINIQQNSEDRLLYMWESCSTFAYAQYAANESFTHQSDTGITFGSDDADVILYLFRAYERSLTTEELKSNFIFDGVDGNEIQSRKDRNSIYDSAGKLDVQAVAQKNPNVHVMIINADRMTLGKKDVVSGTLQHIYVAGGVYHNWTAPVEITGQGTTSLEHAKTAGANVNCTLPNGIKLEDGTVIPEGYAMYGIEKSIPTNKLTYKKNIASQDHIVNAGVSEWYNQYQPYIRDKRKEDPRVRDCMESCMCVVFFHNTSSNTVQVGPDMVEPDETIFFGLGNLCSNKDSEETFEYEPIVIEVRNNTEPQILFKSDDLSESNFDNNYEFRYLDESQFTKEEAKAEWQKVQSFVHACDWTSATNTALPKAVTYNGQAFTVDSAAYRKAKWKAEAPNYFQMETLYHHGNMVLLFLLRDNCGKNMFWSYNSITQKWALIFAWDHDTAARRNNEGYVDIDRPYLLGDTVGSADVYNASDNVIWTNLMECNADELKQNYIALESAGGTDIDAFYALCATRQSYICEALWIEDAEHNAIRTMQNLGTTAYLGRATGRLRLHLKHALIEQKVLVDSYYCSTTATADSASFRGYTPSKWTGVAPNGKVKITPYTDMFINILAGSTAFAQRANAGEEVEIDISAYLNDTEIYLRHAPWIMKIGDMSGLYLGQFEASKLKRVRVLHIGSDVDGYKNTNFTTASFENCTKLEELNLGGLVNATKSFDFSPNLYLMKLYSKGSGATGFIFAQNGRLKEAEINGVASLTMKGLKLLENFSMESYENLASVTIEDSPSVDSYAMAKAAINLARVRLLEIDWRVPVSAYDVLMRLDKLQGIDDDGFNTDEGVLTGNVYFTSISDTKYTTLVDEIPGIAFTYGEKLEECTVTFLDGSGSTAYVTKTEKGGSVQDPVFAGLMEKPTKESTVEYGYEYYGWDKSLDYIVEDTTFTPTFREYDMTYIIQFVDYDGTVLEEYIKKPHENCFYQGADLNRAGYVWAGWDKTATDITGDMVIQAVYIYPTLPAEVLDLSEYDYAYSNDPEDNSAYTYAELYAIINTNQAAKYLPQKAEIKFVIPKNNVINDDSLVFNVHSYGHYELADGSGKMSNVDFYMKGVLISNRQMNTTNTNAGGWDASALRKWLNNEFRSVMPIELRNLVKKSITLANAGNQSTEIISSEDWFRIPSTAEMRFDIASIPYCNEVSTKAAEIAFDQYTDNNSRIKKKYNGKGTAQNYWTRSAESGGVVAFRGVISYGFSSDNTASYGWGACVGFSG